MAIGAGQFAPRDEGSTNRQKIRMAWQIYLIQSE